MKRLGIAVGTCIFLLYMSNLSHSGFYYNPQGIVELDIDSSKVLVKFVETRSDTAQSILDSIYRIVSVLPDETTIDGFLCCSLMTGQGYNQFIDSLEEVDAIYLVEPYYTYNGSHPMPVGETFIVAYDITLTGDQIDSINTVYGVTIDHLIYGFESIYVVRNTDVSGMRLCDLANLYHESPMTHFAYPRFGGQYELHAYILYDFYHICQPHLKKIIGKFNERSIWDFAGWDDSVVVAVVDDGIDDGFWAHHDLPDARVLPGWNFYHNNDNTDAALCYHGMACAGIIAAEHTTNSNHQGYTFTGVVGMNPHAKIIPVKCFHTDPGTSDDILAAGLNYSYEYNADVVSCSWGKRICFSSYVLDTAVLRLYNDGRNGLGTPMIFSSGNDATDCWGHVDSSNIAYPACMNQTLAVGAIDLYDERWWYSQFGLMLDVVAPSGDIVPHGDVWTIDGMGYERGANDRVEVRYWCTVPFPVTWECPAEGQNNTNLNCNFGGTSAAAPFVSGIVSLLIARNPNLTVDEIYDIIRNSAQDSLNWGPIPEYNHEYGYGRADAYRAVLSIARGDANNDGTVNNSDQVYLINWMFKNGPEPEPDVRTADANCDGDINMGDAIYVINYVFKGGPAPPICFEYDY